MSASDRTPCNKCGTLILLATVAANSGLCGPCHNKVRSKQLQANLHEDEIAVFYTVCPHRGGHSKVTDLRIDSSSGKPVLRHQHGSNLPHEKNPFRTGFHRIHDDFEHITIPVQPQDYDEIVDHIRRLSIPAYAEPDGGFDGTDYSLVIQNLMTKIEFRWWVDLPESWSAGLSPIIEALDRIRSA